MPNMKTVNLLHPTMNDDFKNMVFIYRNMKYQKQYAKNTNMYAQFIFKEDTYTQGLRIVYERFYYGRYICHKHSVNLCQI